MLQETVRNLKCALAAGLLATVVLLATACGGPASPTAPGTATAVTEQGALPAQPASYDCSADPGRFIRFEPISVKHGLSQSSVYCILQDSKGFMWFGTEDGLNKYDGYDLSVYKPVPGDPNSLSENTIKAIYEDHEGVLWIGTEGGGLDRFDRDTEQFTHYQHSSHDSHSLSSNIIRSIYEDREGVLWIGTEGGGLNKFDRETERFTRYKADRGDPYSLSNNVVRAIHQDREGVLWIATNDGLDRFDREKERFFHYRAAASDFRSRSRNAMRSIWEDQSGELWIGTLGGGLARFDHPRERFIYYQNDPRDSRSLSNDFVRTVYEDRAGGLWVGTDSGLNRFDRQSGQFVRYHNDPNDPRSLSSDVIRSVYEDRSGVLWIGTYAAGVNKFDCSTERFTNYQADSRSAYRLSSNYIRAIYQDREGILWVGTHGGGLNRVDREKDRVNVFYANPDNPHSLSRNTVRSILADRSGTLWVGTEGGGLDRFDRATGHFIHYRHDPADLYSLSNDTVLSIYEDSKGVLWIGTWGGGLDGLDRSTGRFFHYRHDPGVPQSLSSNYVSVIYEDREGVLWIGTWGGGLNKLVDRGKAQFIFYSTYSRGTGNLSDDTVLSIHEDREGVLWIGTAGGGLNRFDRETGTFTYYRERNGLPNDVVYGILEDDQECLWLSTNKGLSRFDPRTETFTNYDASDGLQGNEFNGGAYHKSSSGEMFFGGLNGLTAFYPHRIKDNPYIPPVVLASLTQGGEAADVGQAIESVREVTFRWPNNFLEFEFAALSYSQPEKNQYAYMLEGLDKDWNYIGTRRFGRYTNLPGGTYTLRLKGSNNDGVWNEEGASIKITIVPPFWETWWFRGIVVLAVVGGAIGGHRLRVRSIEARSRELETLVEQRTAELRREIDQRMQVEEALRHSEMMKAVAAERSRLARDLHDAVTQTLFSASLIAEALPASWERDQEAGRQLLRELRQLTRGALAEMRTLLLELRPAALVETSLGDLLRQLAEAATGREGVPATVAVEGQNELPADVHIALYRIAQEALNNVTKHARASQVTVRLRCAPRAFSASTEADGKQRFRAELCVSDDGCGFDPDSVPSDRLGLGIMRERVQAIGATLTIGSRPGHGTRITVVWEGDEGQRANS